MREYKTHLQNTIKQACPYQLRSTGPTQAAFYIVSEKSSTFVIGNSLSRQIEQFYEEKPLSHIIN